MRTEVSTLLVEWRDGDEGARNRLVSIIYDELRRMAAASLRNENCGHTLQPTALVHELYLHMFASGSASPYNRKHLLAIAARQMRRILVDHARSRRAEKRGGGKPVSLEQIGEPAISAPRDSLAVVGIQHGAQDLLEIDEALSKLAELDERAAQVIELRFFVGMTETETADALGVSVTTVKRDWDFARAWLYKALDKGVGS